MDLFIKTALSLISWLWVLQPACGWYKSFRGRHLLTNHLTWIKDALKQQPQRPVVIIAPVKGHTPHLKSFLDFVLNQDYSDYRVIFVTESTADTAHQAIKARLDLDSSNPCEASLVVAGLSQHCGQKVHNQLAALKILTEEDDIIALIDSDTNGPNNWLACLVFSLNAGQADFTSSNRWFLPMRPTLATRIPTLIAISADALLKPGRRMLLWGGSMAMTRAVYDELDLYSGISGSLNDDIQITHLAIQSNKCMRYARSVATLTPINYNWAGLIKFGRRQYFQLRIYRPPLWWTLVLILAIYVAGFSACVIQLTMGNLLMLIPLSMAAGFGMARDSVRLQIIHERFTEPETQKKLDRSLRRSFLLDPFVHGLHLLIMLSTAFGRKISWSGIRYLVKGRQSLEVLQRDI